MAYFEQTKLTDAAGNVINPAKEQELLDRSPQPTTPGVTVRTAPGTVDDQIILLRRIVKLLESQAATDTAQRQRITVDAITAGTTLPTVTTVGTVSSITAGTITTVGTVSVVTNIAAINGWNQQMFVDPARTAYNTGIRAQLTFA
jgi:hypothetical protein